MEKKKLKFNYCRRKCCVGGCNKTQDKNRDVSFYEFPKKDWQKDRKQVWINAVRKSLNNKTWMPTSSSRICSSHFVGGQVSKNPSSIAYNPTILNVTNETEVEEIVVFEVVQKEEEAAEILNAVKIEISMEEIESICIPVEADVNNQEKDWFTSTKPVMAVQSVSIGCQTDPFWGNTNVEDNKPNVLFCSSKGNEISIQTDIARCQGPEKIIKVIEVESAGFSGYRNIKQDNTMLQLGGVNLDFFNILLNLIIPGEHGQPKHTVVPKENRLLLFLMKLKLGISFCDLAVIFRIHRVTASEIFYQMLRTITTKTKTWIFWPTKQSVQLNLPISFSKYRNCRCILDFMEIETDTPSTLEQKINLYSDYNGRYTIKFLICITPDGYICKVSEAYGGKAIDSFITNDSGFLNLIEPGDLVLTGKSFPQIKSELSSRNAVLVQPPYTFEPQFTAEDVKESYDIPSVCIHVERAIQHIKKFQILRHVGSELVSCINEIMHVCCVLANSKPSLVKYTTENV